MILSQPKFHTLLGLSSLIILLWGCAKAPQKVILKGQINNTQATEIYISGNETSYTIALDSVQSFTDTLEIASGYYSMRVGNEYSRLYLTPGQTVAFEVDAQNFDESLRFQDPENQLLIDNFLRKEQLRGSDKEFYSLPPDIYSAKIDSIAQVELDQLEQTEVSPEFKALEKKEITYTKLWLLEEYEMGHKYFTAKEEVELPDGFKAPLEGLDFDLSEDFKNHQGYRSLVYNHSWRMVDSSASPLIDYIQKIKSPNIQKALVEGVLAYQLTPASTEAEKIYSAAMEISTDSTFKAEFEKKYNKIQKILKGKEAPVFENYENYAGGTTSLTDLLGKYVYIDVWATWCGPCKREIPHLKKVEHEFKDHNINFVSISIDKKKDYQAWRDMVQEKELGGIQLFAEGAWKSSIVKDYAIDGIPRFILIDPDGKIVNADAPRPSQPKLRSKLKKLLK